MVFFNRRQLKLLHESAIVQFFHLAGWTPVLCGQGFLISYQQPHAGSVRTEQNECDLERVSDDANNTEYSFWHQQSHSHVKKDSETS